MNQIFVNTSEKTPDKIPTETLYSLECMLPGCGWRGDIPFSKIYLLPV